MLLPLFGLSCRIEIENLTKYYGILAAIEDVSFTVQEGEILKVSRETQKVVHFLTGHGERDPGGYDQSGYSQVTDALSRENYVVGTLNLAISSRYLP
ncbi:unnamed protein product, partial [marine sediment metagenome]